MRRVMPGAELGERMRRAGDVARRAADATRRASAMAGRASGAVRRAGVAARRARPRWLSAPWAGSVLAVPAVGILLLMMPTADSAVRLATRVAAAAATLSRHAPRAPATAVSGRPVQDSPAVGALFDVSPGGLGQHFCTASVVDSPHGDLVITAAHCVSGRQPSQILFIPGYHDGSYPYGVWLVTRIVVDAQWRRSHNPDHDVAFLVIGRRDGTTGVQRLTGGERLGTGEPAQLRVRVIGYPDRAQRSVVCTSRTLPFGGRQMRFDCGGYTDGTSGGPFLAQWDAATGRGTVVGVIGGYEQGGDLASVSYSARFGRAVEELYLTAVADSR